MMSDTQNLGYRSVDDATMPSSRSKQAPAITTPYQPAREGYQPTGVSLISFLNILLRHRRLILSVAGVSFVLAVSSSIFLRDFVAEAVFMPQTPQQATSSLAGLAAQFGLSVPQLSAGDNTAFYAELPTSRELLRELALTEFQFVTRDHPTDTLRGTPVELFEVDGETPRERTNRAIDLLHERIEASPDPTVGVVVLKVTAPSAELAELMNRRILTLISDFNLKRRQSQAAAQRRFVEKRMAEARRGLDSAEAALESFLEQNRRYQESPRLAFEQARLQRRIDLLQEVYISLAKSYEQARIEEVRDTPVITIVDPPEESARRSGAGPLLSGLLGIVVGGLLGVGAAIVSEFLRRERDADSPEYAELVSLLHTAFRGVLSRRLRSRDVVG